MRRWLARELAKNDKSLFGFWPLQDNLLDYSGKANHGSMVKGTQTAMSAQTLDSPAYTNDLRGWGFGIYTNDNFIDAGIASDLNFGWTTAFSFSCWLYIPKSMAVSSNKGSILSRVSNTTGTTWTGYDLALGIAVVGTTPQFQLTFGLYSTNANALTITIPLGATTTSINKWYHIACTYDGSKSVNGLDIYVNGVSISPLSFVTSLSSDIVAPTGRVGIGNGQGKLSTIGSAIISSARIYKRMLTTLDILNIYANESNMHYYQRSNYALTTPQSNNSFTLVINGSTGGQTPYSNSLPLYIDGSATQTSGLPLYINGARLSDNVLPLYVGGGGSSFSGLPLYESGYNTLASGLPLFAVGSYTQSAGFNLFLECPTIPAPPHTTPLFIIGNTAGSSGLVRGMPLYITGSGVSAWLNMFLAGSATDRRSINMNMFVEGSAFNKINTLPLYICNTSSGVQNNVPLSITGFGTAPLPTGQSRGASLNLFIKRWPSNGLPLFIPCNTPNSNTMPLFIKGTTSINKGLTLTMPSTLGKINSPTGVNPMPILFISGY